MLVASYFMCYMPVVVYVEDYYVLLWCQGNQFTKCHKCMFDEQAVRSRCLTPYLIRTEIISFTLRSFEGF
jgi:hypothetical protein